MAKTNPERGYSRKEMEAAKWGGYLGGMKRALELAESQLAMARSYFKEQGGSGREVDPDTREGGVLEGIRAVVRALRESPELQGRRV